MRKILLLIIGLCFYNFSYSQFPGSEVNLLLHKTVTPKEAKNESEKRFMYKNFYKKFNRQTRKLDKFNDEARAYGMLKSEYDSLFGKKFKVVAIHEQLGTLNKGDDFVLEIHNNKTDTLFYDYSAKYEHSYELDVVGGLDLPDDFYCKKIEKEVDKFTKETKFYSDFEDGIYFVKTTKNNISKIYMEVRVNGGSSLSVGKKGLILLFENGQKIQKPTAKIEVDANGTGSSYVYSTFVELTKNDINIFKNNELTDVRLYIYDNSIDNGKKLSELLKCIIKAK
ncbi:hypothetical protein [Capnocytophaga canis]|uniref:hypothetical protein n=1 Tax=Capnocytophaga canis TaxID=1848903 RepID=UPI001562A607|nr:hypothetical protein [Capnocytophaga canis]